MHPLRYELARMVDELSIAFAKVITLVNWPIIRILGIFLVVAPVNKELFPMHWKFPGAKDSALMDKPVFWTNISL